MFTSSPAASSIRDRRALAVVIAGAIATVLVAVPFKTFELDRYFVPKELVLHVSAAAAALFCLSTRRRAAMSALDILLALYLVATIVSAVLSVNWWLAQRAVAISVSGAMLFWVASALRRAGLERPLVVGLAVAIVIGAITSLAQAYGVRTEYFSLNRSPGGTFGNRNFVAHLSAIGIPVLLLVVLTARKGTGALLGALGFAIVAAALVLTRSRAGWLAVLASSVPVALLAFLTRDRWRDARTVRRLTLLGATAVVGAAGAILLPNSLEWKSDSPYLESAAGLVNYKEGSGRGRLVQYMNSTRMLSGDPLFGVGPGNWPVVYPKYASKNDPSLSQDDGMTSNPWPSSDWVAALSERGVVGFGLLVAVMLGLLRRSVRDVTRTDGQSNDRERILTAIALLGTVIATIVVGAFDAVLLLAVPAFFVWTLAGALAPPASAGLTLPSWFRPVCTLLIVAAASIALSRGVMQLSSMAIYNGSTKLSSLQRAATLDPGNYRLRVRLASTYLSRADCRRARPQARAAQSLFPNAPEPKRILAICKP